MEAPIFVLITRCLLHVLAHSLRTCLVHVPLSDALTHFFLCCQNVPLL